MLCTAEFSNMMIISALATMFVVTEVQSSIFQNADVIIRHDKSRQDAGNQKKIQPPFNANKSSRYVELVMVVDKDVFLQLDCNVTLVHETCQTIASYVNAVTEPLNIFMVLIDVVIWEDENMFNITGNIDDTLVKFLDYRKNDLSKNHPNDYAVFLFGTEFEEGSGEIVLGSSVPNSICSVTDSGSVAHFEKNLQRLSWTVVHEFGHVIGFQHDTSNCYCEDAYCVMAPTRYGIPRHWSSCSYDFNAIVVYRDLDECLNNLPEKTFDPGFCGNGFAEPGEECDCGLPEHCKNPCCNPYLCVLIENATCATGNCCDISTCILKKAGKVCREEVGECDLPEYCNGLSEFCPGDVFKQNANECDEGKAFCYQGICRSHDSQCKRLFGPSALSSPACFYRNTIGKLNADCGTDFLTNRSFPCLPEDQQCGRLHCQNVLETRHFATMVYATSMYTVVQEEVIRCFSLSIDLGTQVRDPGLVPNGAKCGPNKMCLNSKCVATDEFRDECPNCRNGVCNSKGHCHCFVGWSGDKCNAPGSGGSPDSGPLTEDEEPKSFTKIMFIVFLGVVPCCATFAYLLSFWQNRYFQMNGSPYAVSG